MRWSVPAREEGAIASRPAACDRCRLESRVVPGAGRFAAARSRPARTNGRNPGRSRRDGRGSSYCRPGKEDHNGRSSRAAAEAPADQLDEVVVGLDGGDGAEGRRDSSRRTGVDIVLPTNGELGLDAGVAGGDRVVVKLLEDRPDAGGLGALGESAGGRAGTAAGQSGSRWRGPRRDVPGSCSPSRDSIPATLRDRPVGGRVREEPGRGPVPAGRHGPARGERGFDREPDHRGADLR